MTPQQLRVYHLALRLSGVVGALTAATLALAIGSAIASDPVRFMASVGVPMSCDGDQDCEDKYGPPPPCDTFTACD